MALGAEIGVILLLFMLGLEYSAAELTSGLRRHAPAGVADIVLNFTPGFIAGCCSDGARSPRLPRRHHVRLVVGHHRATARRPAVAGEPGDPGGDLDPRDRGPRDGGLPLVDRRARERCGACRGRDHAGGRLERGRSTARRRTTVGPHLSDAVFSRSTETLVLTVLGITFLVAGCRRRFGICAAVGAFLVGLMLSGPAAERAHDLLGPMRDLFAAIFFVFFGLSIDPATIPPIIGVAVMLGVVTIATKVSPGGGAPGERASPHGDASGRASPWWREASSRSRSPASGWRGGSNPGWRRSQGHTCCSWPSSGRWRRGSSIPIVLRVQTRARASSSAR